MNKRELLKGAAVLIGGGAFCAATLADILTASSPANRGKYVPRTLTAAQDALVAEMAELIIPTTDTPGARAAGVNIFIDGVLTSIYTAGERDRFLAGLNDVEASAKAGGARFVASTVERQVRILRELEAAVTRGDIRNGGLHSKTLTGEPTAQPFFATFKKLTLTGYYLSEIGATQELRFVVVPGTYRGDVPLAEIGRAWVQPILLDI